MEVATEKYIRKPLYVDAVRVTAANFDDLAQWCDGEVQIEELKESGGTRKYIKVRVHNPKNPRQTKAFVGDWILYTERGYKVYTNKAFRTAFDPVTAENARLSDDRLTGDPAADAKAEEKTEAQVRQERDLPPQPRRVGPQVDIQDRRPESPEMKEARETIEADGGTVEPATPQAVADAVRQNEEARDEHQPEHAEGPKDPDEASVEETVDDSGQVEAPDTGIDETPIPATPPEETPIPATPEDETPIAPPPTPAITPPTGRPEPISEQPPEDAAAGKRVLSEDEQRQMGPDAVREMVRSGDVVLAQDLAETH
jgi:hypothetical protein